MEYLKAKLELHVNPLMNYIVEIKRLRVIKTSRFDYDKRLRFTVLDEDNQAFLFTAGDSFCCFRWRHFDMNIKDCRREPVVQVKKDFTEIQTGCICGLICPDTASVELLGFQSECLGRIRENCSSIFASYSYEDENRTVLARLEGPLIISGLLGIGALDFLQPRIEFKLVDTGGKNFGKITRQWGASEFFKPDSYEIEYSGWLSPRLRLLILSSIFMIENRYFEKACCDLFNYPNCKSWSED